MDFSDASEHFYLKLQEASKGGDLSQMAFGDVRCRCCYRSSEPVKKTFISSRGIYSLPDNSYGIMWVGVHGMDDAICVVARLSDLHRECVGGIFKSLSDDTVMYSITKSVMCEMEGIGLHERPGLSIKKPFGVVSVNLGTDKVHEESGHEASSADYDVKKAIHFLRKKMSSGSAFTMHDTVQTAISAFQHLCLEDLKAEDIFICVCPKIPLGAFPLFTSEIKEHLALIKGCPLTTSEIKEHLALIKFLHGKKGGAAHVATPHPSKQAGKTPATYPNQKTPKSGGGSHVCKSCSRSFGSEVGLQSHTKAKHSAGK